MADGRAGGFVTPLSGCCRENGMPRGAATSWLSSREVGSEDGGPAQSTGPDLSGSRLSCRVRIQHLPGT